MRWVTGCLPCCFRRDVSSAGSRWMLDNAFAAPVRKKVPIAPLARRLETAVPGGAGFSCRSPSPYRGEVVEAIADSNFKGRKAWQNPLPG